MGGGKTTIQAPPPPNYAGSMREILSSQIELMPRVFESEQKYQPLFAQLQSSVQQYLTSQAMSELENLYPRIAEIEKGYTQTTTEDELQRLKQQLPQYKETFEALTPGYGEAIGSLGRLAKMSSEEALTRPELKDYLSSISAPTAGGFVEGIAGYTPSSEFAGLTRPTEAGFLQGVQGPALSAGLQNIDQNLVRQYVQSMPGMEEAAAQAGQIAQQELAAGRNLSPEEERIAQQAARSAYAARGTALGNQAVASEILGRSQFADARLAKRLELAKEASGQVQSIYGKALEDALGRQKFGAEFGLSSQAQMFSQSKTREDLAQDLQREMYKQSFGREELARSAQEQAFKQAFDREKLRATTQQTEFEQAIARQKSESERSLSTTDIMAKKAQLAAGALAQMQAAQSPILSAFYKTPMMIGTPGALQGFGSQGLDRMGPQFFNPESQTGMGAIYGAYNTSANLAASQAQINAGKRASNMSLIGDIIGAGSKAATAGK